MSNTTTINVFIATAVASMGQVAIVPSSIKSSNNYNNIYSYTNSIGTNLTEVYHEISNDKSNEQLVLELAKNLVNSNHDLPSDFNQIISENFWDLV